MEDKRTEDKRFTKRIEILRGESQEESEQRQETDHCVIGLITALTALTGAYSANSANSANKTPRLRSDNSGLPLVIATHYCISAHIIVK